MNILKMYNHNLFKVTWICVTEINRPVDCADNNTKINSYDWWENVQFYILGSALPTSYVVMLIKMQINGMNENVEIDHPGP